MVTSGRPQLKTEALEIQGVPTVLETGNNKIITKRHITSYDLAIPNSGHKVQLDVFSKKG